jgi:hypothetical protein
MSLYPVSAAVHARINVEDMRRSAPKSWGIVLAALAACTFAACGDDAGEAEDEQTPFAAALAQMGGGAEGTEGGWGWVDVERLRADGGDVSRRLGWAVGALGPGADERALGSGPESVGIEPAKATRILSLVGSYAIGIRFDGVETARLERAYDELATPRREGPWTYYDLTETPEIPFGTPLERLTELASHAAVMPGSAVLARFAVGRPALIGEGDSPIDTPLMQAATSCLGDAVAARTVPNNYTYLGSVAPQIVAFGVVPADGGWHEVLCVADEDPEKVADAVAGMREAFDPASRDAVSGERMSDLIAGATVEELESGGIPLARAELEPPPGEDPGLLFRAFPRGSTLTYVGLPEPFPTGGAD